MMETKTFMDTSEQFLPLIERMRLAHSICFMKWNCLSLGLWKQTRCKDIPVMRMAEVHIQDGKDGDPKVPPRISPILTPNPILRNQRKSSTNDPNESKWGDSFCLNMWLVLLSCLRCWPRKKLMFMAAAHREMMIGAAATAQANWLVFSIGSLIHFNTSCIAIFFIQIYIRIPAIVMQGDGEFRCCKPARALTFMTFIDWQYQLRNWRNVLRSSSWPPLK